MYSANLKHKRFCFCLQDFSAVLTALNFNRETIQEAEHVSRVEGLFKDEENIHEVAFRAAKDYMCNLS